MVTKKPLPRWKKQLVVEAAVSDDDGEDVDIPFILINVDPKPETEAGSK